MVITKQTLDCASLGNQLVGMTYVWTILMCAATVLGIITYQFWQALKEFDEQVEFWKKQAQEARGALRAYERQNSKDVIFI